MRITMEVAKDGGECSISNLDGTKILRYRFNTTEKPNSFVIDFFNKDQELARREGQLRLSFQRIRYRNDKLMPEAFNTKKMHMDITKFLLERWNKYVS